jgi:hypothetical protein
MDGMRRAGREVLFAVLLAQTTGCLLVDPSPEEPPASEQPPSSQEPGAPPGSSETGLSCEAIRPASLGESRNIVLDPNAADANCGPGAADGAGFLALMNSGPFGATAWDVVSPEGVATGHTMAGGDSTDHTDPQPSGFHVVTSSPGGASLRAFSSEGATSNSFTVSHSEQESYDVVTDPQGGALVATWERRAGSTQTLSFVFVDSTAVPRTPRADLVSAPSSDSRFVIAGVDTQGKALLLWPEGGSSANWVGQWVDREGAVLTPPFTFPVASFSRWSNLYPLAGGGLALRSEGQWVARFASGATAMQPAPAWLASRPGSSLYLIRGQQAHVLVPPPTQVVGSGCQESLLFFTSEGTACGELLLPPEGASCFKREVGVGWDGTVIQQVDLGARSTPRCAWRWWPGLLR